MVRCIKKEDARAVAEICARALGHVAQPELLERRIGELAGEAAYYIAVCEREGGVEGFIQAERYDLLYGERGWNVIALAVRPETQGQGVGGELLRSLERHARDGGAGFVRLNCRTERTQAHAFYAHMGYVSNKTQKYFKKEFVD